MARLSVDKINHISHLILQGISKDNLADLLEEDTKVLREIKRIISNEMVVEDEVDAIVKRKIDSYSRKIAEGSPEWEVLYQKFFSEEMGKRRRS